MTDDFSQSRPVTIPGFEENYRVSARGNVFSLKYRGFIRPTPKQLKPTANARDGHLTVMLFAAGKTPRRVPVHRLVLLAFGGPSPPGLEACHRDDNKTNNCLENLYWGTRGQNQADAVRNGKQAKGSKCGSAKLTEEQIPIIRALQGKCSANEAAKRFRVTQMAILYVWWRKTWKHV